MRHCKGGLVGLCLLTLMMTAACSGPQVARQGDRMAEAEAPMPLYPKALGPFTRPVDTSTAEAQAYMDQGFQMMYAFAHEEAPRAFREAQQRDSTCALCFWAEAWALGPYLNARMRAENAPLAHAAIQQAMARTDGQTDAVERALIEAMAHRYEPVHEQDQRARLDTAYADAMAEVYAAYPADLDVGPLYAEALMLLEPRRGNWDLDKPEVQRIHEVLEALLVQDLHHPGACHLYIHATESTTQPEKAEACAEYLGDAIPGASHINHMPSHTFNRVGRWAEAVRANIQAWHSDQKAAVGEGFAIYPSHNLHMLLFAASMGGEGAVAIQAGKDYGKLIEGGVFYQVLALVRFGRFDEVLELDDPPKSPLFRGLWDFGQGYAHLRAGHREKARKALERVERAARTLPPQEGFRGHSPAQLLGVVGGILKGELLRTEGRVAAAITAFEQSVALEDSLQYDEPEPLNFSARDWLGAALLEAGRPAEAEAVYREALRDHPRNGWSLFGLEQALRAQDRGKEAEAVHLELETAWAHADTWIRASRF